MTTVVGSSVVILNTHLFLWDLEQKFAKHEQENAAY